GSGSEALASPRAENGLVWDAVAQAGALLRSGSRENPLVAIEPRRIAATGFGEAASALTTFINARHSALRLGDGSPIFDAYLQIAGGLAEVPINQCAALLPPDDARHRIGPRDAAVFNVLTQTEVPRTLKLRREDSDDPKDVYRAFEVAGAAHSAPGGSSRPGVRDSGLLGVSGALDDPCEQPPGDFPLGLAVNGVVLQLQQWLFEGRVPAHAPPISVGEDGQVARDATGNAIGGLRLPTVQVPMASYSARSAPRRADDASNVWRCSLTGTLRRFDSAEMKRLYGTRAEYLRRFNAAVDQAVADRSLVAADAAALKASQARIAPMF
ncbi:MAG: alpha/beta hydrolase domain-containing protein, partial [Dokdonella sp.]